MPINKLNIYTCDKCKAHIVVKDIDEGVTPFMLTSKTYCPNKCDIDFPGGMVSSMYQVYDQTMKPDYEFYLPLRSSKEFKKYIDHCSRGGLILRKAA